MFAYIGKSWMVHYQTCRRNSLQFSRGFQEHSWNQNGWHFLPALTGDPAAEEWSQWSVCSLTCGQGWQVRTRSCVSSPYGTLCSGALRETRMCNNTSSCPGEPGIVGSGTCCCLHNTFAPEASSNLDDVLLLFYVSSWNESRKDDGETIAQGGGSNVTSRSATLEKWSTLIFPRLYLHWISLYVLFISCKIKLSTLDLYIEFSGEISA